MLSDFALSLILRARLAPCLSSEGVPWSIHWQNKVPNRCGVGAEEGPRQKTLQESLKETSYTRGNQKI